MSVIEANDLLDIKQDRLPDPYIAIQCGTEKLESKALQKTLNPK